MDRNRKRWWLVPVVGGLLICLVGSLWLIGRQQYPFGVRAAYMAVVMAALRVYASEHQGWYPGGEGTPERSFAKLYPVYLENPEFLAGLTGNRAKCRDWLKSGKPLNSETTTWVYYPGFHETNPPTLMILHERNPGVQFNGLTNGGYCVGFADGSYTQIPQTDWETFSKKQEQLRQNVLTALRTNRIVE